MKLNNSDCTFERLFLLGRKYCIFSSSKLNPQLTFFPNLGRMKRFVEWRGVQYTSQFPRESTVNQYFTNEKCYHCVIARWISTTNVDFFREKFRFVYIFRFIGKKFCNLWKWTVTFFFYFHIYIRLLSHKNFNWANPNLFQSKFHQIEISSKSKFLSNKSKFIVEFHAKMVLFLAYSSTSMCKVCYCIGSISLR